MSQTTLALTGKWEFKEYPLSARRMRDLDAADWLQTNVPNSIFASLVEAGQIKQSDIDTSPEEFSWVSEKPWVYRKIFDVPPELLNSSRVDLVFEGLDTVASIWLNEKLIARTNNMFISFRFDVTQYLKPKDNSLLVKFEPAVEYAKKLMNRYTIFSESDFRNPYRVYIRKAQYQFGWDFCPALPGCGIWRPVRLEGIKKAKLADLHIRTVDCNQLYADIKITAELETVIKEKFRCRLTLSCNDQKTEHDLIFNPDEDSHSTVIRIEKPFLWRPAGYGQQPLYQLDVQLLSDNELIDRTQKKFGIRMVKLNRSLDEHGENFQFEVNGQPIFAKGANWVPASIFAGSVTSSDYEKLLYAAAESHINMFRVWGGGYYETEKFYELCDQLGIMVWQDFMFACAYYPDRPWFLEEVKKEAITIIKQLRNHPCLVLWCGNNEIDWMHKTAKLGRSKKFYGKAIYHQLLPQLLAELDPDTNYIPTTPLSEKSRLKTARQITTHQWDVWSGYKHVRHYLCPPQNIPRFVTEFGLQSLPTVDTVKNFCPPDQLHIGSYSIEKHNYQLDGNSRLYRYMADLFGTAEDLDQFAYLSQITQARAVKTYVEYLRAYSLKNYGVLFWQFNDCCPAISWSAIDCYKEPKALYYYAKRFFSKLLITAVPEFELKADISPRLQSISIVAINDSNQPVTAAISCRLIDLFGNILDQVVFPTVIGPFSTSSPLKLPKAIITPAHPDKSALHLLMDKDGKKMAENLFFYLPDKYIDWPEVKIASRLSQIAEKQWKLKLNSNTLAKDVQISTNPLAHLTDNFIDLLPNSSYEIIIDSAIPSTFSEPENAICLRSVNSIL
jgi:beta-mannosidase